MAGRKSDAEARDSRSAILRRAADVASVEGLEGLTIGRLAGDVGMSKAGVLGHFGTKERLQLDALDYAAEIFVERVWKPAAHTRPGLDRLLAISEAWTAYVQNPSFPGGCFIAAASFEYDSRDGNVHDALRKVVRRWRRTLVAEIETAVEAGELPADSDPDQIAFMLESLAAGASPSRYLQGDEDVAARCLRAMRLAIGVDRSMGALVRDADGGRGDGSADRAREHHHRDDERQHLQELAR